MRLLRALAGQLTWPPFAPDLPFDVLRRRYELPTSRWVEVNGVRLHVAEEGQGPPLLLVHGLSSSLHTWDGWVRELSAHHRVVRFDLPGFGLTGPHPRRRYDADTTLALIDGLRAELGIESMHLAGSSLGGFYSWMYALRHPERVRKLILVDPVGYAQEALAIVELLAMPGSGWLGPRINPSRSVARSLREVFGNSARVSAPALRRYQELVLRPGNRAALVDISRLLVQMISKNPYEALVGGLRVPTLLMWGRNDRWIPFAHVARWQHDVPELQTKIYEGVGHVPMEEAPAETARDALEFLSA